MATDLRMQFFNYMTLQRFADHTQRTYVTGVKGLADYYNRSPDTLTNEQIQDYLLYLLKDRKLAWGATAGQKWTHHCRIMDPVRSCWY